MEERLGQEIEPAKINGMVKPLGAKAVVIAKQDIDFFGSGIEMENTAQTLTISKTDRRGAGIDLRWFTGPDGQRFEGKRSSACPS